MNNLQDRLRKERRAADGAVVVTDLGPLQVDVKIAAHVPPHNDVSDVWSRDNTEFKVRTFACISNLCSLADQSACIATSFIVPGFARTLRIHLKFSRSASWR